MVAAAAPRATPMPEQQQSPAVAMCRPSRLSAAHHQPPCASIRRPPPHPHQARISPATSSASQGRTEARSRREGEARAAGQMGTSMPYQLDGRVVYSDKFLTTTNNIIILATWPP